MIFEGLQALVSIATQKNFEPSLLQNALATSKVKGSSSTSSILAVPPTADFASWLGEG